MSERLTPTIGATTVLLSLLTGACGGVTDSTEIQRDVVSDDELVVTLSNDKVEEDQPGDPTDEKSASTTTACDCAPGDYHVTLQTAEGNKVYDQAPHPLQSEVSCRVPTGAPLCNEFLVQACSDGECVTLATNDDGAAYLEIWNLDTDEFTYLSSPMDFVSLVEQGDSLSGTLAFQIDGDYAVLGSFDVCATRARDCEYD